MTRRQSDVLTAIVGLHRERRQVTVRALARALGLRSTTAVRGHLAALERQGVLTWAAGRAGTLHVLRPYRVDLAGRVTPGTVMELTRGRRSAEGLHEPFVGGSTPLPASIHED